MSLVEIKLDPREVLGALTAAQERQVPYALARAMTAVAKDAQLELKRIMPLVFDRPTPFTIQGVRIIPARKVDRSIVAFVYLRDEASKGTPPAKYLRAEVEGGPRRDKRSERALKWKGLMPAGSQAVPSRFAPLDAYGNLRGSYITYLLSRLRALPETGYSANETTTSKARRIRRLGVTSEFFIGRPEQRGRTGVWERIETAWGSAIRPILYFVRPASYQPRLPLGEKVAAVVQQQLHLRFLEAWREALATARP